MRKTTASCLLVLAWALAAAMAPSQDCIFKIRDDDSFRQALDQFHKVMSALLHGPVERGDFGPVRAQAADLTRLRDGVMAAAVPSKLAERCSEISAKAKELSQAVDRLVAHVKFGAADDALKAAFAEIHAGYRNLNAAQTSLADLLEAFREVLHPLWHDAYPGKDAAAIKAEIPKLKVRARLILSTAEASDKGKAPGAKRLLDAVGGLEEAAAKDDAALLEALRIVHDLYEKLAEGW